MKKPYRKLPRGFLYVSAQVVIGGLVGRLAAQIAGRPEGIVASIIIGIVGSFIGSFVSMFITGSDQAYLAFSWAGVFGHLSGRSFWWQSSMLFSAVQLVGVCRGPSLKELPARVNV